MSNICYENKNKNEKVVLVRKNQPIFVRKIIRLGNAAASQFIQKRYKCFGGSMIIHQYSYRLLS